MSDPIARLPARPSLEQLRKQAKDASRSGGIPLHQAQLDLARRYGFESWPKLVHHVAATDATADGRIRIDRERNTIDVRGPIAPDQWNLVVEVMREQRLTGLRSGAVTDQALERVAKVEHVTRLEIEGGLVTDAGLRHLAWLPQLEELDIGGPKAVFTDAGLEVLRQLRSLKIFKSCWTPRISDAGVANLSFCDRLEHVNLMGTATGDGALNALCGKRALRHLKTGRLVSDAGLPLLHDFPVLKTWQGGEATLGLMSFDSEPNHLLLDGPFTDRGMESLRGLDGLYGVHFFWHVGAFSPDALAVLTDLPHLELLGCEGEVCNDVAMGHIGALPRLRMLMGQGTVASDDGFAALARSRTIEFIWGRECPNLTGRGFAALSRMPALKGLGVSCKQVDDRALGALPSFPALVQLMPMDVSDDGFRHVGACAQLDKLWCMYCRTTGDVATGHITGLSRLRSYYAGRTQITDKSLELLSGMPSLEELEFWETGGITNAGIAALARLPRLRRIEVGSAHHVTRDAFAAFPPAVRTDYW